MDQSTISRTPSKPAVGPFEPDRSSADEPDFQAFDGPASEAPMDESRSTDAPSAETPKRRARGRAVQNVRRPVERALAVNKLPVKVRSLLGKSLGLDEASSADVVELTVESLERGRQAKSTITALVSLAKTDAMEAGVTATGLASDKGEFKAVWGLASDLDSNLGTTIPSTQVKAGLALARAAQGLDPSALGLLAKALAILNNEY